ncbi:MAG TPA: hypothetical protein PLN45_04450 [Exilispira sp.]|nr:hypothetical protein [Exilispira sp.]HPO60782.1 hypothetical protein [Exilispira sp.]
MSIKELVYFNLYLQRLGYTPYMAQLMTFVIYNFCSRIKKDPNAINFFDVKAYLSRNFISDFEMESIKIFLIKYLGKQMEI